MVLEDSEALCRDIGVFDVPQLNFLEQGGIGVKEGERGIAKFSALAQLVEQPRGQLGVQSQARPEFHPVRRLFRAATVLRRPWIRRRACKIKKKIAPI